MGIDTPKPLETSRTPENILWGPIGEDQYPQYARDQIQDRFGSAKHTRDIAERQEMFAAYTELRDRLKKSPSDDIVGDIRQYLSAKFPFAKQQFEEKPLDGLGYHLKEVEDFSAEFVLKPDGTSRFDWMTDRQAWLFAHGIAPMHDILKFLGSKQAQIMPDHEVMTAALVRDVFEGKKISFDGRTEQLGLPDVEFIAAVIADHENIEKEKGRDTFITSDSVADKAKAVFFIADTMIGIIIQENGNFLIDETQLRRRFTDLYFRHIDLEKGKIFRPEWGVYALKDIITTLEVLARQGLSIEEGYRDKLFNAAAEAIHEAEDANTTNTKKFTDQQIARIEATKTMLGEMRGKWK